MNDEFTSAYSMLVVATKSRDRYWDGDAVRQVNHPECMDRTDAGPSDARAAATNFGSPGNGWARPGVGTQHPAGAPLLDWWTVTAEEASRRLLRSMLPRRVCRTCGEPSRRIVGEAEYVNARTRESVEKAQWADPEKLRQGAIGRDNGALRVAETLGWSDCGCSNECDPDDTDSYWRPGLVLDPFAGSGTTLAVASGHGLDSVGFDLDPRNAELARERIGMFVEIVGV